MPMKFYMAQGEVKKKLLELDKKREAAREARFRFAERYGAKGPVAQGSHLLGLVFDTNITPPSPWKFLKRSRIEGEAVPTNSAEGRAVREEMKEEQYADVDNFTLSKVLGIPPFVFGRPYSQPDFRVWGKEVVVGVDSDKEPKQCRRISDMEYERRLKKVEAKEKAKKSKSKAKTRKVG